MCSMAVRILQPAIRSVPRRRLKFEEKGEKSESQQISLRLPCSCLCTPRRTCAIAGGEGSRSSYFTTLEPRGAARWGIGQQLSDDRKQGNDAGPLDRRINGNRRKASNPAEQHGRGRADLKPC